MSAPRIVPDNVRKAQHEASNPDVSAWVSANAGSGKTHVLTERVIRLLLTGTAPEKILCITFTKAAAAKPAARPHMTVTASEPDSKTGFRKYDLGKFHFERDEYFVTVTWPTK